MTDETMVGADAPVATAVADTPAPVAATQATDAPEGNEPAQVEETAEQRFDKAQKKMERRIGNLTRRNGELMAQLQHLQQQAPQRPQQPPTEGDDAPEQGQPKPHTQEQIFEAAQQLRRIEAVNEKSNRTHAEGTKEYPDFMQKIGELQAGIGRLYQPNGLPTPLMEAVLDSDVPSKVLYAVASDLDLAAELAAMSPHRMTRRLVQLEAELTAKPKPSAAPKPITPVKPTASETDPDPEDTASWIEARNKRLRSRA